MTLKDFAEKYDIPYRIVYDASYLVHYSQVSPYDRKTYPEKDLFDAVVRILNDRIEKHRKNLDELTGVLDKLR